MVPVPIRVKLAEPTPAPRTKKKRKKKKAGDDGDKKKKKKKKEKKVKLPKGFKETEVPVVRVAEELEDGETEESEIQIFTRAASLKFQTLRSRKVSEMQMQMQMQMHSLSPFWSSFSDFDPACYIILNLVHLMNETTYSPGRRATPLRPERRLSSTRISSSPGP